MDVLPEREGNAEYLMAKMPCERFQGSWLKLWVASQGKGLILPMNKIPLNAEFRERFLTIACFSGELGLPEVHPRFKNNQVRSG